MIQTRSVPPPYGRSVRSQSHHRNVSHTLTQSLNKHKVHWSASTGRVAPQQVGPKSYTDPHPPNAELAASLTTDGTSLHKEHNYCLKTKDVGKRSRQQTASVVLEDEFFPAHTSGFTRQRGFILTYEYVRPTRKKENCPNRASSRLASAWYGTRRCWARLPSPASGGASLSYPGGRVTMSWSLPHYQV